MFYQYLQDNDQLVTLEGIARPESRLDDMKMCIRDSSYTLSFCLRD